MYKLKQQEPCNSFQYQQELKKFTNARLDELNRQELLIEIGGEDNIKMMAQMYLKTSTTKQRLQFTETSWNY